MKNIKITLKKLVGTLIAIICLLPALFFIIFSIGLFIASDYNIDFLSIDTCLDHGGRWNYEDRVC